jgi:outer membrane protein OmpA-like peptidoglycan-associated protein
MGDSKLQVSVKKPCAEKWDAMSSSEKGRFCTSCSTEVVDFTRFSESQLQDQLSIYKNSNFCGKFRNDQLGSRSMPISRRGLVYSFLALFGSGMAWAQEKLSVPVTSLLPQRDCGTSIGIPVVDSSGTQIGPGKIEPDTVRVKPDTIEITMGVAMAELDLKPVEFGFDKSEITAEAMGELGRWLYAINTRTVDTIKITGHADSTGNYTYNVKLSERRAEEVKRVLIEHGVKTPIVVVYHGFRSPRESNDSKIGRARNRRVDIRLIEHHKVESK